MTIGLYSILLVRLHSAIIPPLIMLHCHIYSNMSKVHRGPKLLYLIMFSRLSFFVLGNSNSLATVDLSNSYVGVGSHMILAGGLTYFCTFAGPLCCIFAMKKTTVRSSIVPTWFLYRVGMTCLCIAVTILRNHLFIWSVFSPKVLYEIIYGSLFVVAGALAHPIN